MNLIEHAKNEFDILGWPGGDEMQKMVCDDVLELLEVFSKQGHSGMSAPYVLGVFERLAKFNPIGPLTGKDSEWAEVSEGLYQNKRDCEVFKDEDGKAYWINGRIFEEEGGVRFTNRGSRVPVTFPWTKPEPEIVKV